MLEIPIISGFTQHDGLWNGCHELRERILAELDEYSALSVRPRLYRWNDPWKHIARQMHLERLRYYREPFGVVCFAYSYGVGHGLVNLASYLNRYGINIDVAVTCDGIYRHWFSPKNWRALYGGYQITLPENVKAVDGFYQDVSRPMGVKPKPLKPMAEGGSEYPRSWRRLQLPHVEMDDAYQWHDQCAKVAIAAAELYVPRPSSVPVGAPPTEATEVREATNVAGDRK